MLHPGWEGGSKNNFLGFSGETAAPGCLPSHPLLPFLYTANALSNKTNLCLPLFVLIRQNYFHPPPPELWKTDAQKSSLASRIIYQDETALFVYNGVALRIKFGIKYESSFPALSLPNFISRRKKIRLWLPRQRESQQSPPLSTNDPIFSFFFFLYKKESIY